MLERAQVSVPHRARHDRRALRQERIEDLEAGLDRLLLQMKAREVDARAVFRDEAHVADRSPLDRERRKARALARLAQALEDRVGVAVVGLSGIAETARDGGERDEVIEGAAMRARGGIQVPRAVGLGVVDPLEALGRLVGQNGVVEHHRQVKDGPERSLGFDLAHQSFGLVRIAYVAGRDGHARPLPLERAQPKRIVSAAHSLSGREHDIARAALDQPLDELEPDAS